MIGRVRIDALEAERSKLVALIVGVIGIIFLTRRGSQTGEASSDHPAGPHLVHHQDPRLPEGKSIASGSHPSCVPGHDWSRIPTVQVVSLDERTESRRKRGGSLVDKNRNFDDSRDVRLARLVSARICAATVQQPE